MGKVFRIVASGDDIWIEGVEGTAPEFAKCAECWEGSGCEVRGACIIDEVADGMSGGPFLADATMEQISAEVEKRRKQLDAWRVKVDESAAAMPSWAAPLPPVPLDACDEACCNAPESHGEAREGLPLSDWLMGYDDPPATAHSEAVSDPDALLILNIAGMLLKRGVSIEDVCARLLTPLG